MSIEAHKCNVEGCKGFVVFENADFDFKDIQTDKDSGFYAFCKPHCSECGKRFLVVPHYTVIDIIDKDAGDFEELDSTCITKYEKRQKERKYEAETDPSLRIMNYLMECGYTYSVSEVLAEYSRHQELNCYVSFTMKDCFKNLESEIRSLLGLGEVIKA